MKFNITSFLLTGILCYSCHSPVDETTVIKKLLEKESATWRSGDIKAHADCWKVQPYTKILISTPEGKFIDLAPSIIVNPPAGSMGKGGYAVNSNYKMSIGSNKAWVSHDEISTSTDSIKSFTSEIRLLEKVNGQWKLVGESIHAYKP